MTVRIILAAVTCSLLVVGRSAAQPGTDMEQRLRALEGKMDRVLTLLEDRNQQRAALPQATAAVQAARDRIQILLDAKVHSILTNQGCTFGTSSELQAEKIARLEKMRAETKLRMQDLSDQLARIEKALIDGGPGKGTADAMRMIRALGFKLSMQSDSTKFDEMLMRLRLEKKMMLATLGPNNPKVMEIDERIKEVTRSSGPSEGAKSGRMSKQDDPQAYIVMMREQIRDMATKIDTLAATIESETKTAGEMKAFEKERQQLDAEIARLRQMVSGLDEILHGNDQPRRR